MADRRADPGKDPGKGDTERRRSPRRDAERSASAALARMFDGSPPEASAPDHPAAAHEQAIHAAVMAGLDAFAGSAAPATSAPASSAAGARAGGGPSRPDGASRFEDLYEDLDEDLALIGLSGPRQRFNPLAALGRSMTSGLAQAGEMTWLAAIVVKSAVTRPRGYWGDTKEQIYSALKLCWVPMIISITAFGIGAPGLQGGNVFTIFGVPEREGSFIVATGIREFAPWIDAMIVAGVVGTAITADIGARRIREEIDAMEVLGVDPIRELVLPRILSTAIITGLFDIVALLVGIVGGYIASVLLLGASTAGYTSQFFSQANVPDLLGSFAKTFLFGAVVGVVCCYKGMRASGGPAGVGKAVNSAVVISFALIWTINYVFTNTLLGFAPSTQVFH